MSAKPEPGEAVPRGPKPHRRFDSGWALARAREVLDVEIDGLRRVRDALGDGFARATARMLEALEAGRKIIVTGVGKNIPIGQKIAATLTSTGSPAVFLHPSDAMHGELGIVADGDVVLALSYSGESEELLNLIPAIRRHQTPIVAITGSRESSLARLSDEVILAAVEAEACPFNMAPTASTTATLAVGDAIAMVLLEARGFRREDYAKLHPGGAIGRTLLLRVEDIMRTGARLATVPRQACVKEAVAAMSAARGGCVVITNEDGTVAGIFTDGDLRRHLDLPELANRPIESLMTPRPITIQTGRLAVDVLALFERHNIDDLVVTHPDGRVAGVIDIQDLPKFKIL